MANRTLSDIEVTARYRNRGVEKNLEDKLAEINKKLYSSRDVIKGEMENWRKFVHETSRNSGWSPRSLRPELGEDVLVSGPTQRSQTQNTFNKENNNKFQRPWAYTYSHASHNKVYKELHQAGTNSQKMLALRSQMSTERCGDDQPNSIPRLAQEVFSATGVNKVKSMWGKMPKLLQGNSNNGGVIAALEDGVTVQESVHSTKHLARQVTKVQLVNRATSAWISKGKSSQRNLGQEKQVALESKNSPSKTRESNLLAKNVSTVMSLKKSVDKLTCAICGSESNSENTEAKLTSVALSYKALERAKSVLASKKTSSSSKQQITLKEESSKPRGCSCRKLRRPISQIWTKAVLEGSSSVGDGRRRIKSTGSEIQDKNSSHEKITKEITSELGNNIGANGAKFKPLPNVFSKANTNDKMKDKNECAEDSQSLEKKKKIFENITKTQDKESTLSTGLNEAAKDNDNKGNTNASVLLKQSLDYIIPKTKVAKHNKHSVGPGDDNDEDTSRGKQNLARVAGNYVPETQSKGLEQCTKVLSLQNANQIKEDGSNATNPGCGERAYSAKEDKELSGFDSITRGIIQQDSDRQSNTDHCPGDKGNFIYNENPVSKEKINTVVGLFSCGSKSMLNREEFCNQENEGMKDELVRDNRISSRPKRTHNRSISNISLSSQMTILETHPEEKERGESFLMSSQSNPAKNEETEPCRKSSLDQNFKKIRKIGSVIKYSNSFLRFEHERKHSVKPGHLIGSEDSVFVRIAKNLLHSVKVLRRFREIQAITSKSVDKPKAGTWLSRQRSVSSSCEETSSESQARMAFMEETFEQSEAIVTEHSQNSSSPTKKRGSIIWEKAVCRASVVRNAFVSGMKSKKDPCQEDKIFNAENFDVSEHLNKVVVEKSGLTYGNSTEKSMQSSCNSQEANQKLHQEKQHESGHEYNASGNEDNKTDDMNASQDSHKISPNNMKPSRGLPPNPFDSKSHVRFPATYHKGIRLTNYVSPQLRYKTVSRDKSRRGLSIRWHSSVGVMVNAHQLTADHGMDTVFSKDARQRALAKLVEENHAKAEEEVEVISRSLKRRIEQFLTSVEPFCTKQE